MKHIRARIKSLRGIDRADNTDRVVGRYILNTLTAFVTLTATLIVAGWIFDVQSFVLIPPVILVTQLTAALLLLTLISGSLLSHHFDRLAALHFTSMSLVASIATLLQYMPRLKLGADFLLYQSALAKNSSYINTTNFSISLSLIFLSISLLAIILLEKYKTAIVFTMIASLCGVVISSYALVTSLLQIQATDFLNSSSLINLITLLCSTVSGILIAYYATIKLDSVSRIHQTWNILLTSGVGTTIALTLWFAATNSESRAISENLTRVAETYTILLEDHLTSETGKLWNVERFFAASVLVEKDEFSTFSQYQFSNESSLLSIDWIEKVKSRNQSDEQVASEVSDESTHYPVIYSTTASRSRTAAAFDHYSDPLHKEAMDKAARSGNPQSTFRWEPSKSSSDKVVIEDLIVFIPVYSSSKSFIANYEQSAEDSLRGFVVGTFRWSRILANAFQSLPSASPVIQVFDTTNDPSHPIHVASYSSSENELKNPPIRVSQGHSTEITNTLSIAGKSYLIRFRATPAFIGKYASNVPYILLLVSIILTVGGSALLNLIRQRNRAKRELEKYFRSSFEGSMHGMALVSLDGHFLYVNAQLLKLLGCTEEELLSRSFSEITDPDNNDTSENYLNSMLASKRDSFQMEKRYLRNDGSSLWVLISVSVITSEKKQPLYFITQVQDITFQKTYEGELEGSKKAAEAAAQAKGDFLADISHEIRTPLTAIIGFTEQLLNAKSSEKERAELTQIVLKNAHHLLDIINDTLDYSKIEAGKLSIHTEQCSLLHLIDFVESTFIQRAKNKGLSFDVSIEFPVPSHLETDPLRLKQILLNLIGNAIKFTENGGVKLNVAFRKDLGRILFTVIDTGIGVTSEQLEKLFQVFTQADCSTTRRFGGTGLGLAISKRLAHMLGGEIIAESRYRVGSTFTLSVPAVVLTEDELLYNRTESHEKPVITKPLEAPALRGKVLVVEDGADNQRLIRMLLEKCNLQVEVANDGQQALTKGCSESIDVVLMDMQMPILDGYSATKLLRARGFNRPIIGCTADASIENKKQLSEIGCTGIIFKPFTSIELYSVMKKYLPSAVSCVGKALDENEMNGIRQSFVKRLSTRIATFKNAHDHGDYDEVAEEAHKLAGATMFGFPELGRLASELERCARDRNETRSDDLLNEIYGICQSLGAKEGSA